MHPGDRLPRLRILAVLMTVVTAMSVIGAAVVLRDDKGTGASARSVFWEKRLQECAQLRDLSMGSANDKGAGNCFGDALYTALTDGSITAFADAAVEMTAADPWLNTACHEPAHGLGHRLLDHYENDWEQALLETTWNFCDSGALHGLYDVWGESSHSDEEWLRLVEICQKSMVIRLNGCPDAVGHAAYESLEQDPVGAMRICSLIDDQTYARDCAMGVVMQHYNPNNPELLRVRGNNVPEPSRWPELLRMCEAVTGEITFSDAVRAGCAAGAGWIMGVNISVSSDEGLIDQVGGWTTASALTQKALDLCTSTPGDRENGCAIYLLRRMPLVVASTADSVMRFCDELSSARGDESLGLLCQASSVSRMSSDEQARLFRSVPGVRAEVLRIGQGLDIG
jgi:hypothetical protein